MGELPLGELPAAPAKSGLSAALSEVIRRARSQWKLKVLLSCGLTALFYTAYFALQRLPLVAVTPMAPSFADRWVPFRPHWAWAYLSLTLLLPIAPWLMDSRDELRRYRNALLAMMSCIFTVFLLWPTACPRPETVAGEDPLYRLIRSVDGELNAFPSFHGALTVFSGLCFHRVLAAMRSRRVVRAAAWTWCLAILYATLATKQHVLLDIVAGGVIGGTAFAGCFVLPARLHDRSAGERGEAERHGKLADERADDLG